MARFSYFLQNIWKQEINFTVSGVPSGGYVLIDKIIIDIGNDQLSPISIDTEADIVPEHWPYNDCIHADQYTDFSGLGCPLVPEEDQAGAGYWSPCDQSSCKIEHATSPSILPSAVHIKGYIADEGQILVAIAETGNGRNVSHTVIDTKSARLGAWLDYSVDLTRYRHHVRKFLKFVYLRGSVTHICKKCVRMYVSSKIVKSWFIHPTLYTLFF